MNKEQAEKIALDHPCKETCSGWKQGYEAGLTASSVKVPSEDLIRQKCRENAQLILDHHDKLLKVDGVEDLLYSLVRGLFPNPEWAIKRMQEA